MTFFKDIFLFLFIDSLLDMKDELIGLTTRARAQSSEDIEVLLCQLVNMGGGLSPQCSPSVLGLP